MCDWLNINALFSSFYISLFSFFSSLPDLLAWFLFAFLFITLYLPLSHYSPLSLSLFPIALPHHSFAVCPIWTVTCLIFSRPSSPLCRALLPSPLPTVPGEVRYLHTYTHHTLARTHSSIYIYEGSSRYTEMWRRHVPSNTHKWIYFWNIPSGQSFTCLPVHLSDHLSFYENHPSIHHHSISFLYKLMLHDPAGDLWRDTVKEVLSAGVSIVKSPSILLYYML